MLSSLLRVPTLSGGERSSSEVKAALFLILAYGLDLLGTYAASKGVEVPPQVLSALSTLVVVGVPALIVYARHRRGREQQRTGARIEELRRRVAQIEPPGASL